MLARPVIRFSSGTSRSLRHISSGSNGAPQQSRMAPWIAGIGLLGAAVYIATPRSKNPIDEYNRLQKGIENAPKVFAGGDQGFVNLKLANIQDINHNTKRLTFQFDDDNAVSGLNVASALLTKFQPDEKGKPIVRPYTPISSEDTTGHLELLIKKYPNGPMSTHIHDLKIGETLEFKGPIPKYPWSTNKHEHVAMIAGGTGITPMYQVIRHIFSNPNEQTKVTLVFGNISEDDILLRPELSALENEFPQRLEVLYTLDNPPDSWRQQKGFITKEVLKQVLPDPSQGEKIKIFVCGPPGMYKAISGTKKSPADQGELSGYLKELGYNKDQVFKF